MPSRDSRIRVLCVDDNELVVDAIRIKLNLVGGFSWLGQLTSAECLPDEAERRQADIVLLDIDLPGRDPFDALREMAARGLAARVLMFSGQLRCEQLDQAIEAGAWGHVSKHQSAEAIIAAIHRVMDGHFVLAETTDRP